MNLLILSEVEERTRKKKSRLSVAASAGRIFLLSVSLWAASAGTAHAVSTQELNDCNWTVTYRGRTYDLAPITREALARPIETDLRYALQRVPEANAHLETMGTRLRDAKAHTILASIFITGFLAARLLESRENDSPRGLRRAEQFDILSIATGSFFVAATFSSWKATKDAKSELVNAVDAFNRKSAHKIEAATPGYQDMDVMLPVSP